MEGILPVVLAGGSGSRLWPLSRELYPKQFLAFEDGPTLFQRTLRRITGLQTQPVCVVCNHEHRFIVAEQARAISHPLGAIVLEPAARNTAPAIALAAFLARQSGADPILLVLPADHQIDDEARFCQVVRSATAAVADGAIMTFGVVPTHPETGYGYIRLGNGIDDRIAQVLDFVEKPELADAEAYAASGEYRWNSGIYMFKASTYLDELHKHAPAIFSAVEASIATATQDLDFVRPGEEFCTSPADSIDYAISEKTDRAMVISLDLSWSDLGSWDALWAASEHDAAGNVMHGDVLSIDTTNSYVRADDRLVATIGLDDIVIVENSDAVLIAAKSDVQRVKDIVAELNACGREEYKNHPRVYRPWGTYETVEAGHRYQVKRITVNPGASLSSQMHHHRSEHWVVVTGTANVIRDGDEFILSENESTYIPLGATHRLSNPGKVPLDLIEIQVGAYLGEDDIVRFDDDYGRAD
ncbi:MAG: mannose-1-phosphate guanylyltransferase/mannose-6-phosphate isomerase [Gammaproteobacteria bacterium]|nr:mannose-1-phosphate guanylyltransferase/mannose-6-phosphate isomerase [Gammaproteobacteria bacterium]